MWNEAVLVGEKQWRRWEMVEVGEWGLRLGWSMDEGVVFLSMAKCWDECG